ncbi:MAG TPA: hypothetical protein VE997_08395 [Candidatus Limnocylindria bacterium]|nr:hypothetical protein [Candidatus Limnocylindria bacterium]
MRRPHAMLALAVAVLVFPTAAAARSPGDPIRLVWVEGDVAGTTTIYGPDGGEPIGLVEYRQKRHGDRLSSVRIAHFRDGSSDEDSADARVEGTLEAVAGRTIIRDADGVPSVDVTIDVAGGRIAASWGRGAGRRTLEEKVALPKGTYWGPLIFIVLKNFNANAEDGRLVFRTVAPTPRPRVFDLELAGGGDAALQRPGATLATHRFELGPTIHWTVDPILHLILPRATFWMLPGEPPALARFAGPRNYAREGIMIQ